MNRGSDGDAKPGPLTCYQWESAMNWKAIVRISPDLPRIEAEIRGGGDTLGKVMLHGRLHQLVGPLAEHPRLRTSEALRTAYCHLSRVDRQRRASETSRLVDGDRR